MNDVEALLEFVVGGIASTAGALTIVVVALSIGAAVVDIAGRF